jgi:hypothetical protein
LGNIVIQNTTKRAIILSEKKIDPVYDDEGRTVSAGIKVPSQTLAPGENDVDDACWNVYKQSPSIKIWVREGYLLEIPNKVEAIPLAHDTTQVDVESMIKKIYKCEDEATLQDWADNDGRRQITRAVKEQLKELRRGPRKADFDTKNEIAKAAEKKRPRGRPPGRKNK